MRRDGQREAEELNTTEERDYGGGVVIDDDKLEEGGIFTRHQTSDNVRFLLTPGKDMAGSLMCGDLPSMSLAYCLSDAIQNCGEYKDQDGIDFYRTLIASTEGIKAARANLGGDCIIGERRNSNHIRGFGGKIKKAMGWDGDDKDV